MNRLKDLREENDWYQKDVAKKLGITQRNYSYLETEQTMLTVDILKKIALLYNTSIDYLVYVTDERKPYPKSKVDVNAKDNEK